MGGGEKVILGTVPFSIIITVIIIIGYYLAVDRVRRVLCTHVSTFLFQSESNSNTPLVRATYWLNYFTDVRSTVLVLKQYYNVIVYGIINVWCH